MSNSSTQIDSEQLKYGSDFNPSASASNPSSSSDLSFNGDGVSAFQRRGEDSSYGGGERGKDIDVSGGSEYGDGRTEFGGAGRLNDDSYSRGEEGGSLGRESTGGLDESDLSGSMAGRERQIYP
ncbi:hypothetical protein JCM10207_008811 [Rhodosporidiobolus poonsookiae]